MPEKIATYLYRGLAERKADGKLDIKIPNYSYAEDGLLIWNAIYEFAGDYLRLHYDDNKPGEKVGVLLFWPATFKAMNLACISTLTEFASLAQADNKAIWNPFCRSQMMWRS